MYLLGIDVGTSSIKVSVVDAATRKCVASSQFPEEESGIISLQAGWAEQDPEMWWEHVQKAILNVNALRLFDPLDIAAIGIAYQMHGLVIVDKAGTPLRNSIIWCDSRAIPAGNAAFDLIGHEQCLTHLLNSPGNFTAAKLAWVKKNEPAVFEKIAMVLLPGDYISLKLTGGATTTNSALSEGMFWDFKNNCISEDILSAFGFSRSMLPGIQPVFSEHGRLMDTAAAALGLRAGIPVSYKAGDQPNNALSLNVLEPGQVAATAGTSGVIYGVSDQLTGDKQSRVNTFAHVNHSANHIRTGILLCINGTGIMNRWVKDHCSAAATYEEMNVKAGQIAVGSNGLRVLPFGNGAERMLNNKVAGAHFLNIDLNVHTRAHLFKAVQEGIAFSFRYGLDILRENGMSPSLIRAGRANLFLSEVFTGAFVNATGVPVELYPADGSIGAALGAGFGAGIYSGAEEAFGMEGQGTAIYPELKDHYEPIYQEWRSLLEKQLAIHE